MSSINDGGLKKRTRISLGKLGDVLATWMFSYLTMFSVAFD